MSHLHLKIISKTTCIFWHNSSHFKNSARGRGRYSKEHSFLWFFTLVLSHRFSLNIQCLSSWYFPGSRAELLSVGPQGCSARALGDEESLHSLKCSTDQQDMEQRGTAPSSPSWLLERGELISAAALQHVGRGQTWANWTEEKHLLTNTLQRFSSKVTLIYYIYSIIYKLTFFWRCPCTPTTKISPVLLPTAVLSWTVQHSWPLHMNILQPLRVLWLGLLWVLDFFPLNGNYSQSSFSGSSLFPPSTFILAWHLLEFSCEDCTWSQIKFCGKFKENEM